MSIITRFFRLPRFHIVIFVLLTLALTLGLAINLPVNVQAQSEPPSLSSLIPEQWEVIPETDSNNDSRFDYRQGVGACGGCVFPRGTPATTLVPLSGIGQTVAEYPTLFWYIPKTDAWGIELRLQDANNQEFYSTKYVFTYYTEENSLGDEVEIATGTPGIISLRLPGEATRPPLFSPLEIGQQYRWTLRIICNSPDVSVDVSGDAYINGAIKRVPFNPLDERFLTQATLEERLAFYTKERIWYETVDTLMELRRERPDDQDVTDAWNKLLKSVELEVYTFLSESS